MKKIKWFLHITCLALLLLSISVQTVFAYSESQSYTDGQFSDVQAKDWFNQYVKIAYNSGLMKGTDLKNFSPYDNMSVADAVTLAVRINSVFTDRDINIPTTSPWYQGYVQFAVLNGILSEGDFKSYTQPITRFEFAKILNQAIPKYYLLVVNPTKEDSIPGVPTGKQGYCVYDLYRAGILTGSDGYGTFSSEGYITRAEIATIVSRITNPELRISKYDFKTPQDLVNYLNKSVLYYTLLNPYSGLTVKHEIMQNDSDELPYDFWIQTEIEQGIKVWYDLEHSISLSKTDKQDTLSLLRDLQKRVYYYFSSYFPEYKVEGGYYNSWYKYPNLKVGYQSCRVMTWKNYEGDSTDYYDNKITQFRWDTIIDDYVFPED